METRVTHEYIDRGFGFPVVLEDVPMIKLRGHWTPRINFNSLAVEVLRCLVVLDGRLSGSQVKFVRLHFEMTLQGFASRFGVTHVAVLKWERTGSKPTGMGWSTEKDIRLFVSQKLDMKPVDFMAVYNKLETAAKQKSAGIKLGAEKIAA